MLPHILFGSGLALAAGLQPGPLQAFMISRAIAEGWQRTLPVALAPLLSDGPIAVLVMTILGRLPLPAQQALRSVGGILLISLAWSAFARLRQSQTADSPPAQPSFRSLPQAVLVNLLNPNPYLAWSLVLGPAVVSAWQESPGSAIGLLVSFYGVMTMILAATIVLAASARVLGARGQRWLGGISAAILLFLGLYQLAAGIAGFVYF